MNCAICPAPAIGIANLTGHPGTPCYGSSGTYALCQYHYSEVIEQRWANVDLAGWEPFPEESLAHVAEEPQSQGHTTHAALT